MSSSFVSNPRNATPADKPATLRGSVETRTQTIAHYLTTSTRASTPARPLLRRLQASDGAMPHEKARARGASTDGASSGEAPGSAIPLATALAQLGLTSEQCVRLARELGERAFALVSEQPYRLTAEPLRLTFATADGVARRLGVAVDDPRRMAAGFREVLHAAERRGHCALEREMLVASAARLLGLTRHASMGALERLRLEGVLASDDACADLVYSPTLFEAEAAVAQHIARLRRGPVPWGALDVPQAIRTAARVLGFVLSGSQHHALATILRHKVTILTGGPGTGKTALCRALLAILSPRLPQIDLAAPIGRVARELKRATGHEAGTLHQLLRGRPGCERFGHHAGQPLTTQLVIVDEMSLVDVALFRALLEAIPNEAALLLIGDPRQLESVGCGSVQRDLIACGLIATARLTETHRQGERSNITYNADRAAAGLLPQRAPDRKDDFEWLVENDPRRIPPRIVELAADRLPRHYGLHPTRDIQVLTPRRLGNLGAQALNQHLQAALNPSPVRSVTLPDLRLGVGDRVLQQRTDRLREVYNGDVGVIEDIDPQTQALAVRFFDGTVRYAARDLHLLTLAYAYTVHRAQGSEFPAVILPLGGEHAPLLSRAMLHTAFSRGRVRVVAIGEERALELALSEARQIRRITGLQERLRRALKSPSA